MPDPRLELAVAFREAGLIEKADALLSEIVHEQTGIKPIAEISTALDDNLANLRCILGLKPKRRRAANPKPTVQERLVILLYEAGVAGCAYWKVSKGYWLRDQQDVMRWECLAARWGDRETLGEGFHVGSWSSMSDCVRYGITVADDEKHGGGYCTISVGAKYPSKIK